MATTPSPDARRARTPRRVPPGGSSLDSAPPGGPPDRPARDQEQPGPLVGEEPPVPAGHIRLYRGETVATTRTLPEWVATSPSYQASAAARARWFTHSRAAAADYVGGGRFGGDGTPRVVYVDLPLEVAAWWALTNTANRELDAARTHSAAWDEEYFLPPELAERAAELQLQAADAARPPSALSAGEDPHGREATKVTVSRPTPHWVRAVEVLPGDVVELTYSNGKLLEVESAVPDTRMVQGVAEPVVVFHGWMLDPQTGGEQRVDDATWGVGSPLWWLDNLRDGIAYAEPAHDATQAVPGARRVEPAMPGGPPEDPAHDQEQPGPPAGEQEIGQFHPPSGPVADSHVHVHPASATPMPDAALSKRDTALAYAAAGIPVFPCYSVVETVLDGGPAIVCACGDLDCGSPGKHPLTWHGVKEATSDPERVATWWERHPAANIGIATGVAFDVLDLDGAQGVGAMRVFVAEHDLDLSRVPVVRTGSGGYHYLFAPSGGGNRAGLLGRGSHVDWRGIGGYVIAPPSQHASGDQYRWVDGRQWNLDTPLPPVPGSLLDKVQRREQCVTIDIPRFTPEHTDTAYARAALEGELAKVRAAPKGSRNHTLNVAGCKLFSLVAGGVLDERDAREGLTDAADQAGLKPREIEATLKSAYTYASGRPRGIPARPFATAIPSPADELPGGELTIPT